MEEEFELHSDFELLDEEQLPDGHKSGFVAIVGRPNVGKSTLLNNFLQQKIAIVSPRPQTTRSRQLGILTRPEYQIIFVDTPGIMQPRHKLDEFMLDEAMGTLEDVDIVLWLVDASEPPGPGDEEIAGRLRSLAGQTDLILGMNKADLLKPEEVMARADAYRALLPDAAWILFSATEGRGVDELFGMLLERLPEGRALPARTGHRYLHAGSGGRADPRADLCRFAKRFPTGRRSPWTSSRNERRAWSTSMPSSSWNGKRTRRSSSARVGPSYGPSAPRRARRSSACWARASTWSYGSKSSRSGGATRRPCAGLATPARTESSKRPIIGSACS